MWQYEKKLQYPVKIANPNPALAKVIISQLGGADGELGAALRYLNQRYSAPCREVQAILNALPIYRLSPILVSSLSTPSVSIYRSVFHVFSLTTTTREIQ